MSRASVSEGGAAGATKAGLATHEALTAAAAAYGVGGGPRGTSSDGGSVKDIKTHDYSKVSEGWGV